MSIGKNTAYNLVGFIIPTVLGLATVPAYIHLIGPARYGVLSLVWLILGYFGLFDLGLGRATTQRIAELRDASRAERAKAFHTALVTNLAIGVVGCLILWAAAYIIFSRVVSLAPDLRAEAVSATPLVALALPIATTLGVLSGALMGREKFLLTNRISATSTTLFQILPLFVAWRIGVDLRMLVTASLLARGFAVFSLWRACGREFALDEPVAWDRAQLMRLLRYGSWMTLSSMTIPFLAFTDRFLIGSILGPVAVTIYNVPSEAVKRITGVAGSVASALFPRFATEGREEAVKLATYGADLLYALVTPAMAVGLVLMDPLMRLWLGQSIGAQAAPLARIFMLAYWLNTFLQIPFTRLQAGGRPDLVTKIMAAELLPYIAGLYWSLKTFGLAGGAWAFFIRMVVDGVLLSWFADTGFPRLRLMLGTLAALLGLEAWLTLGPVLALPGLIALAALVGLVGTLAALLVLPQDLLDRLPAPQALRRMLRPARISPPIGNKP